MTTSPDTLTITAYGKTTIVTAKVSKYSTNDRTSIVLYSEEEGPYGTLTVNLPDQHLNEGEVFIKDWSENEALAAAVIEAGWLIPTGREVQSGFTFPKVMRLAGPLA